MDGRDAAALQRAAEGGPGSGRYRPWGGRCFKYRPPLGSSRPSNMDCAVRIIQKSPPICSLSPSLDNPSDETTTRGAVEPPVIGSSNGARAQNGVLDGAATSPLHGSAPPCRELVAAPSSTPFCCIA